jgi:hypothetical protein
MKGEWKCWEKSSQGEDVDWLIRGRKGNGRRETGNGKKWRAEASDGADLAGTRARGGAHSGTAWMDAVTR